MITIKRIERGWHVNVNDTDVLVPHGVQVSWRLPGGHRFMARTFILPREEGSSPRIQRIHASIRNDVKTIDEAMADYEEGSPILSDSDA